MIVNKSKLLIKIGSNIRLERKLLGYSQELLAQKASLHRTYIGMVERAEKNITLLNFEKIAKALGINLSDLL